MTSRTLKIEIAGDFFRRKTHPKIRLQGQWLAKLGFNPGSRVTVDSGSERGTHSAGGKGDGMNDRTTELFGEPVYSYTRRQAIEDGVLVDLMQPDTVEAVKEAGFKFPVAMSIGAFTATICEIGKELPAGQDIQGRLWDVLWMLSCAIKAAGSTDRVRFRVGVWDGKRRNEVRLWAHCGPGDDAAPVITIMLEGED